MYCIVSKFSPTRFGSRKVFRDESHVPSPTVRVFEEYVELPAGEREDVSGWGAMIAEGPPRRARRAVWLRSDGSFRTRVLISRVVVVVEMV